MLFTPNADGWYSSLPRNVHCYYPVPSPAWSHHQVGERYHPACGQVCEASYRTAGRELDDEGGEAGGVAREPPAEEQGGVETVSAL